MSDSSASGLVFARGERSDVVARRILGRQLDVLLDNLDGARDNRDPECLHDLRVATRRTRSALGQIKGVFPEEITEDFAARFSWLQQVSGPTRDLDVYLRVLADDATRVPPPLRVHLEPLHPYLARRYDQERARLVAALGSGTFQRLIYDWRVFLATPVPEGAAGPNAAREIGALAEERLQHLARRMRREARAIGAESPPEQLHELRKRGKKLRYLTEFFAPLYPPDETHRVVRALKRVLDRLGAYQDLSVQVRFLIDVANGMRAEGGVSTETLLAMGALIGHLLARQREVRDGCDAVLADFLEGRQVAD